MSVVLFCAMGKLNMKKTTVLRQLEQLRDAPLHYTSMGGEEVLGQGQY